MGIIKGVEVEEVKVQRQELLDLIRQSNVQAIFAGDQHSFSKNEDPEKSTLTHVVTGALVSNDQDLRNPQKPRFTLLEIYEDGSYKVKEVVL